MIRGYMPRGSEKQQSRPTRLLFPLEPLAGEGENIGAQVLILDERYSRR